MTEMERGKARTASGPTTLPAAGGTPITVTADVSAVAVLVYALDTFRYAFNTAHFNAGTYMVLPAGVHEIPLVGQSYCYIERDVAVALANGIFYQVIDGREK